MSECRGYGEIDTHSVRSYNIRGKLSGVGRSILVHAVHEMDDYHDIQRFVSCCGCTHDVVSDELFGWSIARGLLRSYSLCSVPIELTDAVCLFFSLHFKNC